MKLAESQRSKKVPDESTNRPQPGPRRGHWTLTQEAFDKLLAALSLDREEAASQYESLRAMLIRYFESHSVTLAENRADEVLNRVARRIDEGQQVDNTTAYAYRVAYLVFLETLKEPEHTEIDLDASLKTIEPDFEDNEKERRQRCFDRCLDGLTRENRDLILSYYQEERRAKIDLRKNLAATLTISLDALRIRAHRIRKAIEECIAQCLGQPA